MDIGSETAWITASASRMQSRRQGIDPCLVTTVGHYRHYRLREGEPVEWNACFEQCLLNLPACCFSPGTEQLI